MTAADLAVAEERGPYVRSLLSAVCMASFFLSLSSNTLSVAVPTIVRHFHASALIGSLIVLTPSATSTSLLLTMGRLGDVLGRRACYLAGIICFTIASLVAGFAPTPWVLICLQACAAVGVAAIWANSAAIIVDQVPAAHVQRGMGAYITAIFVAEIVGPSVGGAIAGTAGWRWIFWLNVPVGTACLVWSWSVLRRTSSASQRRPVDVPGNAMLLVGLGALIISLSFGQSDGWLTTTVIAGVSGSVLVIGAFLLVENMVSHPLLDLGLFRDRSLSLAMLSGFLNAMAQWSPVLLMVLYFQAVAGDSPLAAGLKTTPLPIFIVVAAASAGRLGRRVRPATLAVIGSVASFVGLAVIAGIVDARYGEQVLAFLLIGSGSGLFMPNNAHMVMFRAPRASTGLVNGTRLTLQNVGFVVSTAIVLTLVTAPLAAGVRHEFFAGTASRVSPHLIGPLLTGYSHAFAFLAGSALAGSAAALMSQRSLRQEDQAMTRRRGRSLTDGSSQV